MTRAALFPRLLAAAALVASSACSLVNKPKPLPDPPRDGGVVDADMFVEDGAVDGGEVDASDVDMGPLCRARELCFNGPTVDDDCDGVTDCADLDCANEASCCREGAGGALLTESWDSDLAVGANWRFALPDTVATFQRDGGAPLSTFGADGLPHSLMPDDVAKRCVPLALGARIEVVLHPTTCADCADEAAILLTGADRPASGVALAADLRVAVAASGAFRVTSGSTALPATGNPLDASGRVVIDISPSAQDGVAVLSARVLTGPAGSELAAVNDVAFIPQSLLRACSSGPGLAIAVEGRGSAVTVGPLTVTPLACTNPRIFAPGGNVIPAVDGGLPAPWASGGMSAPALLPEVPNPSSSTDPIYRLFYDATNVERDLESIAPVAFAVGAAYAGSFGGTWNPLVGSDGNLGDAYVGATLPACTAPGCASERSVREPTATASYSGDTINAATYVLAFARETAPTSNVFAIEYVDAPVDIAATPPAPSADGTHTLVPATTGGCTSVRDPGFAQAGAATDSGLWLFYTCEHGLDPSTIRAVALQLVSGRLVARVGTDAEVLGAELGAYAARGVEAPAAIVRVVAGAKPTLAVRLWFIAHGSDGRRSLALAEGQVAVVLAEAPASQIPPLEPYAANPLFYGDAPVLGACDGSCDVRDVGIGRLPFSTDLTVLVARRVDRTTGGTEWQLVPLAQTLEASWWGSP